MEEEAKDAAGGAVEEDVPVVVAAAENTTRINTAVAVGAEAGEDEEEDPIRTGTGHPPGAVRTVNCKTFFLV